MKENGRAAEILGRMLEEGYGKGTEQYEICKRALKYLGFTYERSENLSSDTSVDCSTLVSQSHWEGAAIGVPFIAENQRTAKSGKTVSSPDKLIPADVLVKYPSVEESPDGKWNHVGLYLGRDEMGDEWLIESRSDDGVTLSKIDSFNPRGGAIRFTRSTRQFTSSEALSLAPLVPKFGRLGVRQYMETTQERTIHTGLDLYVDEGTQVFSTTSGTASPITNDLEQCAGVEIENNSFTIRFLHLKDIRISKRRDLDSGEAIGRVSARPTTSEISYPDFNTNHSHLHLEIEIDNAHNIPIYNPVVVGKSTYLNHLYYSQIGYLGLPIDITTL